MNNLDADVKCHFGCFNGPREVVLDRGRLKVKRSVLFVMLLCAAVAWGDDGEMLRRDISRTPEDHTEHAALTMLELYVPAQASSGELLDFIEYFDYDGNLIEERLMAKPIIGFFQDGHVEEVPDVGFSGHGHRDAYAAVSLDDGETWKRTNLSKSGDLSSITIRQGRGRKVPYPGDVVRLFGASAGNKAMLVWASRYCSGGKPTYAVEQDELDLLDTLVGETDSACQVADPDLAFTDDLCPYLEDYWGVSGSQGTSDFADEGYPSVGIVPYSCMWAARGTLEPVDADGNYDSAGEYHAMIWRKAERLTSGRRDANRMEVHCEAGAGCVVTWQEDPDGLRPGEGEGPGEGWSGAIAHHQTDTWYAYIAWDDFDLVNPDDADTYGAPITMEEFTGEGVPQVGIPMSIPVRLTDNAMCVNDLVDDPYCYVDFDDSGTYDICSDDVDLTFTDPASGQPTSVAMVCIAEDGRLMRGNTASTRPRTNLRGYDIDGDGDYDSAWVIVAYEENKGLGEELVDAGISVDPTKVDMGKNIWYHTFDMFEPEYVSQGLMLNQPAQYKDDFTPIGSLIPAGDADYNFMLVQPDPIYEEQAGITTTTLYQTEIARRFSLISQDGDDFGPSGTAAFAMWKQGIIRRGGPADVMARRFVIPDDGFDSTVDNPYAYENMVCDRWLFTDGSNPRYVKGLCLDSPIGLSNTEIGLCDDNTTGAECADLFPWNAYFDDIEGGTVLAKLATWLQVDPADDPDGEGNLDDTSWANPYDVAKGHRGYMDGDFIMVLYAWSPNWKDNTVGHDNYNLYARRSFDGGQTWTTTPASFVHTDGVSYSGAGTTTCEWMTTDECGTPSSSGECPVCTTYAAGDFEQARNLSQLVGIQETILDPRYSPTRPTITADSVPEGYDTYVVPYLDDTRDPSRFFMVYETGDNTTVSEGEAEPLDLFYSRAVTWGDHYLVWAELSTLADCLPSVDTEDDFDMDGFCNEFDWLEGSHRSLSGEASVTANPGGTQFYALWNQEDEDDGEIVASDAWFRRVAFIDDYVPADFLPGGGGGFTDIDQDGHYSDVDCDDNDASVYPGAPEICGDFKDNDCDGEIDEDCGGGTCDPAGTACTVADADQCCSGLCHPRRFTCK